MLIILFNAINKFIFMPVFKRGCDCYPKGVYTHTHIKNESNCILSYCLFLFFLKKNKQFHIMVLADLGRKINSALSDLTKAPVIDEKV